MYFSSVFLLDNRGRDIDACDLGNDDRDRRPLLTEQKDAGQTADHEENENGLHGSCVASSGL